MQLSPDTLRRCLLAMAHYRDTETGDDEIWMRWQYAVEEVERYRNNYSTEE